MNQELHETAAVALDRIKGVLLHTEDHEMIMKAASTAARVLATGGSHTVVEHRHSNVPDDLSPNPVNA